MEKELVIKIEGEVKIIDNIEEVTSYYEEMLKLQDPTKMNTDEDFEGGKKFIKKLEKIQEDVKKAEQSLFNDDIKRLKMLLDGLNKTCASTKTQFNKAIDNRKLELITEIITEVVKKYNVECDKLIHKDVIIFPEFVDSNLESKCKESFKGRSSFDSIKKIANELLQEFSKKIKDRAIVLEKIIKAYKEQYESMKEVYSKSQGMKDCVAYLNNNKDADFVKNDLFRIITEVQTLRKTIEETKEEEERIRFEEELKRKELEKSETRNKQIEEIQNIPIIKQEEIIEHKTVDISEGYEGIIIPKKDTYFRIKYKEIGEHTQIVIFAGVDKDHLAKCGQIAMRNQEFYDFKCLFPANDYINLNLTEA